MARGRPDPIDVAVGSRIRLCRKWMGVSQVNLARTVGVTFQQVQKYEHGTNRVSASMLVKIARALDTTVAALVGESPSVADPTVAKLVSVPDAKELVEAWGKLDAPLRRAFLAIMQAAGLGDEQPALSGPTKKTRRTTKV